MLAALLAFVRAGVEVPGAIAAAERAAPGGPLAALRAFAGATEGQLDDQAAKVVEDGLEALVDALDVVTGAAADLADLFTDPSVRNAMERAAGAVTDLGYHAGRLRALLDGWRGS